MPMPVSSQGTQQFQPVNPKSKIPTNIDRGPFPESQAYNPYGGLRQRNSAYGRSQIFGGPSDLIKSLNTRALGVDAIVNRYGREPVTPGLLSALGRSTGGNPLLQEEFANRISPSIERSGIIAEDQHQMQLGELMRAAYLLGGGLYGGQAQAWAAAKGQDKARKAQRTAELQGWIGAFLPKEAGIRDIGQGAAGGTGG